MNLEEKLLLPLSQNAMDLHKEIEFHLKALTGIPADAGINEEFKEIYSDIMKLYDVFQKVIILDTEESICCKDGCTMCCLHWTEDVYSFEAEIIAQYLKENHSDKIKGIMQSFYEDALKFISVQDMIDQKLEDQTKEDLEDEKVDRIDLLLSSFYQLRRPCALLDENQKCIIYPVRPLTCRIYVNFSEPTDCDPDLINNGDAETYILDLEDEAQNILERLNHKYEKHKGDRGLRSLLLKILSEEK